MSRSALRKSAPRLRAAWIASLAVLAFAGLSGAGVDSPPTARGFHADQVYQFDGIDAINEFNGNLTVSIPIGSRYSAGSGLLYQLRLSYNSNLWDQEYRCTVDFDYEIGDPFFWDEWALTPQSAQFSNWSALKSLLDSSAGCTSESVPVRTSNAGHGWLLSFGELPNSGTYVDSSGAEHRFYATLQNGIPPDADPYLSATAYSRDGSYLRMRRDIGSGHTLPGQPYNRYIDFPDGTTQTFGCTASCNLRDWHTHDVPETFRLDSITDAYGNEVDIVRDDEPTTSGSTWRWRIIEQRLGDPSSGHQTIHTIYFRNTYADGTKLDQPYKWVVDKVLLATTNDVTAEYDFHYSRQKIYRDTNGLTLTYLLQIQPPSANDPDPGSVYVPWLTSVDLPDSTTVGQSSRQSHWSFDYLRPADVDDVFPPLSQQPDPGYYHTSRKNGRLKLLTFPSGGSHAYTYGGYVYSRRSCGVSVDSGDRAGGGPRVPTVGPHQFFMGTGVVAKTLSDPGQEDDGASWLYIPTNDNPDPQPGTTVPCTPTSTFRNTIIDPFGNTTVHYFSSFLKDMRNTDPAPDPIYDERYFGLPFSPDLLDPSTPGNDGHVKRYLSSRTFGHCDRSVFETVDAAVRKANAKNPSHALKADGTPACDFLSGVGDWVDSAGVHHPSAIAYRETYSAFEMHPYECQPDDNTSECVNQNRALISTRTNYFVLAPQTDAGGAISYALDSYKAKDLSDFDWLGHYRQTEMSGDLGIGNFPNHVEGDLRDDYTNFNPGETAVGGVPSKPSAGEPWVLGTFASKRSTEGARSIQTNYTFDAGTGFLLSERRLANVAGCADPCALDLRKTYSRTPAPGAGAVGPDGTVTIREEFFGGDRNTANGSTPDYSLLKTYLKGQLSQSDFLCDGSSILRTESSDIDPTSSLPRSTTDESLATTTMSYDTLDRLTSMTPAGEAAFTYKYSPPVPSIASCLSASPKTPSACWANVELTRSASGSPDVDSLWWYDGMGRVAMTKERMPGGTFSLTRTKYSPPGWMHTVSTAQLPAGGSEDPYDWTSPCSAPIPGRGSHTSYENYDPFGRPGTVVAPDCSRSELNYSGERIVQRKDFNLALDGKVGNSGDALRWELYDSLGRLEGVTEPVVGGTQTTRYTFDLFGNIATVDQSGFWDPNKQVDSQIGQHRSFNYDNRGLLSSVQIPEYGKNGVGVDVYVNYCGYDAMGHLGKLVVDAGCDWSTRPTGAFDLSYAYDRVGRVTAIAGANGPIKTFDYYGTTQSPAPALSVGKIHSAKRMNWVPDPSATGNTIGIGVTNTYAYNASTGRVESKEISADGGFDASVFLRYDMLGRNNEQLYETGAPSGSCGAGCRDVVKTYSADREMEVGSPTLSAGSPLHASLQYSVNGMISSIDTSTGGATVHDTITPEADNLARPSAISLAGGLWTESGISYDGRGSIWQFNDNGNSDSFRYDTFGRLVSASYVGHPGSSFSYLYDGFGNRLDTWNTYFAPDSASNRLTGAGISYDKLGDLTVIPDLRPTTPAGSGPISYKYDATGMMVNVDGYHLGRDFLYDADNERVAILDYKATDPATGNPLRKDTWSVRNVGSQVVRDFERRGSGPLTWKEDYVRRGGSLLATITPGANGNVYKVAHLDHLGSPRVYTDSTGQIVGALIEFAPFGTEFNASPQTERFQFTGHERDDDGLLRPFADLDYMHARYYSPVFGRFLQADEGGPSPSSPQSWNRYTYASNNPVTRTDSDGRFDHAGHNYLLQKAFPGLSAHQLSVLQRADHAQDGLFGQLDTASAAHAMSGGRVLGPSQAEALTEATDIYLRSVQAARSVVSVESFARTSNHQQPITSLSTLPDDAIKALAPATHVVGDAGSPTHEGFQQWSWEGYLWEWITSGQTPAHSQGEATVTKEEENRIVPMLQAAAWEAFGPEIAKEMTTPPAEKKP